MPTPDMQMISIIQIALIGILVVLGLFFLWRKIQRLEQRFEGLQGMLEHCAMCPNTKGGAMTAPVPTASTTQAPLLQSVSAVKSPKRRFGVYEAAEYQEADEDAADNADDADYDEAEDEAEDADDEYDIELNPEEEAAIQRIFKNSLLNGAMSGLSGLTGAMSGAMGGDAAFMVFNPFGMMPNGPSVPVVSEVESPLNPPVIEEIPIEETDADTTSGTRWTKTKLSKLNVEQLKDLLTRHQLSVEGAKKQLFERALEHFVSAPKSMDA